MPIAFRCTGCRCRIHVAQRRAGTSVPCPRCRTRVVVPATSEAAEPTALEGPGVERSLASLQRAAGGSFAEESFEIPPGTEAEAVAAARRRDHSQGRVTLPRWAIYAGIAAFPAVAAAAFLCGCLWMAAGRR